MSFLYDNHYILGVFAGSFLFMGIYSVYDARNNVKRLKLAEDGFERRWKRSLPGLFIVGALVAFSLLMLILVVVEAVNAHQHISIPSLLSGFVFGFLVVWSVRRFVVNKHLL